MTKVPPDEWPTPPSERDCQCPEGHTALDDGRCRDQWGDYNPTAGSDTPVEGRCNALLSHWRTRYGEKRYCTQYPQEHWMPSDHERDAEDYFCQLHSGRTNIIMRAKELFQHGMYAQSREHVYDKLEPWDKLLCHALHESLLSDSTFEFAPEFEERTFDFTDAETVPSQADGSDTLVVEVPHATEYIDRAHILWCAAVDTMKMLKANAKIAGSDMEVTSTEHAQLTSPTEDDPSQVYRTIEETKEHHLNLAYSRLVKDRKELLSYGGVVTGTEADEEESSLVVENFTTVEADPEAVDGSGVLDIEADTSDSND